jgi:hypothetical protein
MQSRTKNRRKRLLKVGGLSFWAGLVSVFLLWQAITYSGLIALIGEWQFNVLGRYFPAFTYILLVVLLVVPGWLLFRRPRARGDREIWATRTLRSARGFQRLLFGVAAGLGLAALISVITIAFLPTANGPRQEIALQALPVTKLREGATTLRGTVQFERTAAFDEEFLVFRRHWRFAPMVSAGTDNDDYQFFVELPPITKPGQVYSVPRAMTGVLRHGGLPGEVIRLYRYSGARVEEPYYVLFADGASVRWPHWQVAAQLALGAILFAGLGLWQRRRFHRLNETIDKANATLTT